MKILHSGGVVGVIDQWILDGFKTWIDAFLPGIINLRIYPTEGLADEQNLWAYEEGLFPRYRFELV